jgi:hypothetical protein
LVASHEACTAEFAGLSFRGRSPNVESEAVFVCGKSRRISRASLRARESAEWQERRTTEFENRNLESGVRSEDGTDGGDGRGHGEAGEGVLLVSTALEKGMTR